MNTLPMALNQLDAAEAALGSPTSHRPAKLPAPNPTHSFWIDSPGANPLASTGSAGPLTSDADICIIGAGVTGVSAAYHLAKAIKHTDPAAAPLNVVILEARDFCSGATGRNGGHLTPNPCRSFASMAKAFGTAEAARSLALEHYTASEIVKIIESEGLAHAVDLVAGGHITLLLTEAEIEEAKQDYEAAKDAGVNVDAVEWLSKEYMESHFGTSYPALQYPAHNLWPLKLVTHLYTLAKNMFPEQFVLNLHTRTPVTSITQATTPSRRWTLTTPRGNISSQYIIHATNGYASHLLPHMAGPSGIVPTRGQVVALRASATLTELTTHGWGANEGFEYWFPRPIDGSDAERDEATEHPLIILGGGREVTADFKLYEEDDTTLDKHVGQVLREFLPALFPGKFKKGREPEIEWSGIMGFTVVGDPFVGPVVDKYMATQDAYKGQYISAGYSGHGMPRAFGCAAALADMIVAEMSGRGKEWKSPEWLPEHFLTRNR